MKAQGDIQKDFGLFGGGGWTLNRATIRPMLRFKQKQVIFKQFLRVAIVLFDRQNASERILYVFYVWKSEMFMLPGV